LEETNGDIEKAKDLLKKRGLADAEKRVGRNTGEGLIGIRYDKTIHEITVLEMHCETDFVARTD
jgi:elongation factor Ts